jgi:hypothetical protein
VSRGIGKTQRAILDALDALPDNRGITIRKLERELHKATGWSGDHWQRQLLRAIHSLADRGLVELTTRTVHSPLGSARALYVWKLPRH